MSRNSVYPWDIHLGQFVSLRLCAYAYIQCVIFRKVFFVMRKFICIAYYHLFSQLAQMVHLVWTANSHADTVMETVHAIMLMEVARVGAHQDGLGLYATKVRGLDFHFFNNINALNKTFKCSAL